MWSLCQTTAEPVLICELVVSQDRSLPQAMRFNDRKIDSRQGTGQRPMGPYIWAADAV